MLYVEFQDAPTNILNTTKINIIFEFFICPPMYLLVLVHNLLVKYIIQ